MEKDMLATRTIGERRRASRELWAFAAASRRLATAADSAVGRSLMLTGGDPMVERVRLGDEHLRAFMNAKREVQRAWEDWSAARERTVDAIGALRRKEGHTADTVAEGCPTDTVAEGCPTDTVAEGCLDANS